MNVAPLIKQSSLIYWSWILPYNLWYSAHDHAHRKYRAFGQSHWEEHGLSKASDTLRALMMTRYCLMITSNIGKHTQKHFLGYMFVFVFCFCFLQAKVQYDEYRRFVSHNLTLVRKGLAPFTYTVKLWKNWEPWPSKESGSDQTWHKS